MKLDKHGRLKCVGTEVDVVISLIIVTLLTQSANDAGSLCLKINHTEGVATMQRRGLRAVTDDAVSLRWEVHVTDAVQMIDRTWMDSIANAFLQRVSRVGHRLEPRLCTEVATTAKSILRDGRT